MITLRPIEHALIPSDSGAAESLSAPNYDEFQGDAEIRAYLEQRPESVLAITMAHAKAPGSAPMSEGSPAALTLARREMDALHRSPKTREERDLLWVYEILDPRRPGVRQLGVGGMVAGSEIRTDANPAGSIIRNEGVREPKARGRADLILATKAIIGIVNLGVDDADGRLSAAAVAVADSRTADYSVADERGNRHSVWLVTAADTAAELIDAVRREDVAYVADGNHRSAAAVMAGLDGFLAVLFPTATMGIRPYNRLVAGPVPEAAALERALAESFELRRAPEPVLVQPEEVHRIGLYVDGIAYELRARESTYDPDNAVESIDADIVQREIFSAVLGIPDPGDPRLTFVGSNRDTSFLQARVDELGGCAVALAPVTMEQFVDVCRQNRMMPPKSTWFEPKVRSGLVMALL